MRSVFFPQVALQVKSRLYLVRRGRGDVEVRCGVARPGAFGVLLRKWGEPGGTAGDARGTSET